MEVTPGGATLGTRYNHHVAIDASAGRLYVYGGDGGGLVTPAGAFAWLRKLSVCTEDPTLSRNKALPYTMEPTSITYFQSLFLESLCDTKIMAGY